jgi:glycosyltransferase involved in cell wall biosynthesis
VRITHFVESLERGGLERVVVDLAMAQMKDGHTVHVVCLFKKGRLAAELDDVGIPVTSCDKQPGIDRDALATARKALAEHRTEILHTHNAVAHYHAVIAAFRLPIRRIVNTRHGMGGARVLSPREWRYRLALLRTDLAVAVCSEGMQAFVDRGIFPKRLARVVRNGIRVDDVIQAGPDTRPRARELLGLAPDAFVVGTVGRLNWAKDHPFLIEAFALALERLPQARLVIVGEGPTRTDLETRIAALGLGDRILLTGDRSDVVHLLPAFDVFVLSSRTEGYSIALLEASAAGLPIIATAVGGNAEIVQQGISGRIVPYADRVLLAQAIELMARNETARLAMGREARAWAERYGSVRSMTDAYYEAYG